MTHHDVWPDLINHLIVFTPHFCDHFETNYSQTWSLSKFLEDAAKKQKQQKSVKDNSFKIHEINAAAYHTLIKQSKEKSIQLFSLSVHKLDEKLKFLSQNAVNILKKMCLKNDFAENPASDQKIDALLPDEYRDYCNVFN